MDAMGTMGGIQTVFTLPPFANRGTIQVVFARQLAFRLRGLTNFLTDGRRRSSIFVQI
jgi:hypothetical protein